METGTGIVDSRAVERIRRVVEIKADVVLRVKFARAPDQEGRKLLPQAPVAHFVRVGQSRFSDRVAKAHAVKLRRVRVEAGLNVAQAFPKRHLRKGHRAKLRRASKPCRVFIAVVFFNQPIKTRPRNEIHHLRKKRASDLHGIPSLSMKMRRILTPYFLSPFKSTPKFFASKPNP